MTKGQIKGNNRVGRFQKPKEMNVNILASNGKVISCLCQNIKVCYIIFEEITNYRF